MSPRRAASAWAKQRMPLPLISARLPSALYSDHRRGEPVGGLADEQPVGADAPCAVAHAAGERGEIVDTGVEHDEEVVAEAVVLGQLHSFTAFPGHAGRATRR